MHLLVCYLNKLQNAQCNDKDCTVTKVNTCKEKLWQFPSLLHCTVTINLRVLRALQQTCFVTNISRTEMFHICVFRTTQLSTEYKSVALCPLCARKVPSSNFILKNSYPKAFDSFPQSFQAKGHSSTSDHDNPHPIH